MSNPYIARYTGNGSQTDFTVPATYIRQAHVSVELDEVPTTAYVFLTSSVIRFDVAPGNGVEIVITDQAPGDPLNIYSGSTGISALSLNENFKQSVQLADFAINAAKDIVEGNIPPGTITGDMLASGAVTKGKTSNGVQNSLERADSAIQAAGLADELIPYALLEDPTFTGSPRAPTTAGTNNSTRLATTEFVQNHQPNQLATARTLWGQSFDGSADITGDLDNVDRITSASDTSLTIRAPGTGNVVINSLGSGSIQLRADVNKLRFFNSTVSHYTAFNSESLTDSRILVMADGDVNLTAGTMVPTTGAGATGTWDITATNATDATNCSRSVLAGNGLITGGPLNANVTLTLGTPSNITGDSTNSVTANSHTHAITNTALVAAGPDAIGAYQICRNSSGSTILSGGTVAGSVLNPSNGLDGGDWIAISPPPAGNWRLMSSGELANNRHALFQRVS